MIFVGYSVFAVLPIDEPGSPAILPRNNADDVAATLPQPTSSQMGTRMTTSRTISSSSFPTSSKPTTAPVGLEDEDMELQAALQASLSAGGAFDYSPLSNVPASMPGGLGPVSGDSSNTLGLDGDSIEARMARNLARNREMMAQTLREQEAALREGYEDEIQRHFGQQRRYTQPQAADADAEPDDEEESLRRAIEASRAEHVGEDNEMEDEDDAEWLPPRVTEEAVPRPPVVALPHDRVYDDEDSDLQAALRASLEGLPDGFVMPSTPPGPSVPPGLPILRRTEVEERPNIAVEEEVEEKPDPTPEPTPQLTAEEIRMRRLARFGGQ